MAASRRIVLCRYHLWSRGIDDFGLLSAVDKRRCLEPKWKASFEMAQAKAEVAGDNRPRLGFIAPIPRANTRDFTRHGPHNPPDEIRTIFKYILAFLIIILKYSLILLTIT